MPSKDLNRRRGTSRRLPEGAFQLLISYVYRRDVLPLRSRTVIARMRRSLANRRGALGRLPACLGCNTTCNIADDR